MKVQHIIWNHPTYRGKETGILRLRVIYHGGVDDSLIVQGTFDHEADEVRMMKHQPFDFGPGVAGVSLDMVGFIAEDDE